MLTRLPSGGAADTMAPVGLFQIWNKSDRMFDENSLPGRNHNSMIQALKQWNGDWLRQNIWRCVFYFKRCAFHTNRCMLHLHVCRGEGGNRDARAVSMTNRRIDWKCQGTMKKKTHTESCSTSIINCYWSNVCARWKHTKYALNGKRRRTGHFWNIYREEVYMMHHIKSRRHCVMNASCSHNDWRWIRFAAGIGMI